MTRVLRSSGLAMDAVGESSSTQNEVGEKPVIVRVKRKVGHSLLDAFCKLRLSLSLPLLLYVLWQSCGRGKN